MFFSLIPREMRFFDMLEEATVVVSRAAGKFLEMITKFDKLAERARDLKNEEVLCDAVVEKIIKSLNVSFITPFDREDIHTLATSLDDVLDNMEETAHRFAVFRIDKPTPETVTLARFVLECCGHLEKAVHLCRNLNNHEEIYKHLVEIGRLENEADDIYRNADAALFANGESHDGETDLARLQVAATPEPTPLLSAASTNHVAVLATPKPAHGTKVDILMLIKLREIYSWLEETVDACKDVANVISEIVIKGS